MLEKKNNVVVNREKSGKTNGSFDSSHAHAITYLAVQELRQHIAVDPYRILVSFFVLF